MNRLGEDLLKRTVRVAVVGCGGNGSVILSGLPYLHHALRAWGHPGGLHVTAIDGDAISPANCVRQPFSESEIGMYKCVVLVNRLNLFWGLNWTAVPTHLCDDKQLQKADIVIGCVDTRAARKRIAEACTGQERSTALWLDVGNNAESGQFVLGAPWNGRNRQSRQRLRTAAELFPELIDLSLPEDDQPSCSVEEALSRQSPFINQTLGNHALALLTRLFRHGDISHQGGFVNLRTGSVVAVSADAISRQRLQRRCRRASQRLRKVTPVENGTR